MFCTQCGNKLIDDAAFCSKCGTKILIPTKPVGEDVSPAASHSASPATEDASIIEVIASIDFSAELKPSIWKERFETFKGLPTSGKILWSILALLCLGAIGFVVFIIVALLRILFSSIVSFIVVITLGYVLYHIFAAKYITAYKYIKDSKVLHLPSAMDSESLLHALNGKLNYPYSRGVRFGADGECIIEGRYSTYSVAFKDGQATLGCVFNKKDRKDRAIMLEAIAIRHYVNKFFNPSLPYDAIKYFNALKFAERQRAIVSAAISIAVTVVIGALIWNEFGGVTLDRTVSSVRDSRLTQFSTTATIGEVFSNYFENPSWSSRTNDGIRFVDFTGTAFYRDQRASFRVVFRILDSEMFRVDMVEINGVRQGALMENVVLTDIFNEWYRR